jgi:hypothetical protein
MESSFLPEITLFGEPHCLTSPLSILLTSSHIVQRSFHVISNAINRLRTLCEKHRGWGVPLLGAGLPPAFAATGHSTEQPVSRKIILSIAGNSNRCNAQGLS